MQRVVLLLSVTALVAASLVTGLLAAHWPFWQRAWQWHVSDTGWPATIEGAVQVMHGGSTARALDFHTDAAIQAAAAGGTTQALLHAGSDGHVDAWFAPGHDAHTLVDGRGLTAVLLVPLFAQLAGEHPGLLDAPLAAWLPQWKEDRRAVITPRQLFWQLSGMPAGKFQPLNPFNRRAQLAAGPDFARVALRWQPGWPPGSHFEESPVNAELLALVAAAIDAAPFKEVVQKRLWSRLAADDAFAMLDHRGGDMAAHCCLRASAADWLRLALQLATAGRNDSAASWPVGFAAQLAAASPVHAGYGLGFQLQPGPGSQLLVASSAGRQLLLDPKNGAVLLWIGTGAAPPGLARLLP